MKKIHRFALMLAAVMLVANLTACGGKSNNEPTVTVVNSSSGTIKASGVVSEQNYALSGGPYTVKTSGISMTNGKCELIISPADDGSCTVAVDDNAEITVNINEDARRIEISGASGKMYEGLSLKITVNAAVEAIDVDGATEVSYDAGTAEQVGITASGACQITASGACRTGEYTLSGAVQMKAYGLECEDLTVSASGACSAEVYAAQSLTAKVSGTSSVQYDGNPPDTSIDVSGVSSAEAR